LRGGERNLLEKRAAPADGMNEDFLTLAYRDVAFFTGM
jgi:hypothetical protein